MPPTLILCELSKSTLTGIETYSPFCLKVHRALRHAGLTYNSRHEDQPSAYAALNPRKQVPVLLVDGVPVFDSSEILRVYPRRRCTNCRGAGRGCAGLCAV